MQTRLHCPSATNADLDDAELLSLNALANKGYSEADLDQIGMISEIPDEEPHASAYQTALEGEVAIVKLGGSADGGF